MLDLVPAPGSAWPPARHVDKKAGKVVMTTKAAISADGTMPTLTSAGTDAKGQAIHNVTIYRK